MDYMKSYTSSFFFGEIFLGIFFLGHIFGRKRSTIVMHTISLTPGRGRLRGPGSFGELPGGVRSLGEGRGFPRRTRGNFGNFGKVEELTSGEKMTGKWMENDSLWLDNGWKMIVYGWTMAGKWWSWWWFLMENGWFYVPTDVWKMMVLMWWKWLQKSRKWWFWWWFWWWFQCLRLENSSGRWVEEAMRQGSPAKNVSGDGSNAHDFVMWG